MSSIAAKTVMRRIATVLVAAAGLALTACAGTAEQSGGMSGKHSQGAGKGMGQMHQQMMHSMMGEMQGCMEHMGTKKPMSEQDRAQMRSQMMTHMQSCMGKMQMGQGQAAPDADHDHKPDGGGNQ